MICPECKGKDPYCTLCRGTGEVNLEKYAGRDLDFRAEAMEDENKKPRRFYSRIKEL